MTLRLPSSAILAAGALAGYLFVSFTGCSDSGSGAERPTGGAATTGSTGQTTGTASGSTGGTTTAGSTVAGGPATTGGTATGAAATTGGTPTGATATTGGNATTGGGGSTGAGGSTGTGGSTGADAGNSSGCVGVDPAPGDRCATPAMITVSKGGSMLIDDLEPAAGDTATCHKIKAADGRVGSWNSGKDTVSPAGSVVHSFAPPGAGGAQGSTQAIHVVGKGLNGYGGYLAVPFAPCYDASAYPGLSFWFKGDPATAPWMKLSILTPESIEAAEGGKCIQPPVGHLPTVLECYDNFSVNLFKVSSTWTRYAITWQQLAQYGWGQPITDLKQPQSRIIGINFSPVWVNDAAANKSFDFWVDDLSFDTAGPFTDTGLKQIVTQAQFNGAYAGRNMSLFADPYTQLAAALDDPRFSRIGREGSTDDRKREIAALMAHVWQETNGLQFVNELAMGDYCMAGDPIYPCAAGKKYFGRGPLQLSWNYNYGQAGDYLGVPTLLGNPDQVSTDAALAWRTSMFFWMAWKKPDANALLVGPHYRFLHEGFGASIRAVNGALECAPTGTAAGLAAAENRKTLYKNYCAMLGVTPDTALTCPAM